MRMTSSLSHPLTASRHGVGHESHVIHQPVTLWPMAVGLTSCTSWHHSHSCCTRSVRSVTWRSRRGCAARWPANHSAPSGVAMHS